MHVLSEKNIAYDTSSFSSALTGLIMIAIDDQYIESKINRLR